MSILSSETAPLDADIYTPVRLSSIAVFDRIIDHFTDRKLQQEDIFFSNFCLRQNPANRCAQDPHVLKSAGN